MLAGDRESLGEPTRPRTEETSGTSPRRVRISARPWVGSSARRSTAAPVPTPSQATLTHQWMPYER